MRELRTGPMRFQSTATTLKRTVELAVYINGPSCTCAQGRTASKNYLSGKLIAHCPDRTLAVFQVEYVQTFSRTNHKRIPSTNKMKIMFWQIQMLSGTSISCRLSSFLVLEEYFANIRHIYIQMITSSDRSECILVLVFHKFIFH